MKQPYRHQEISRVAGIAEKGRGFCPFPFFYGCSMQQIFDAFNLAGPAGDLKTVGFFGLAMALVFCAVVILARIFDIRIGNNDDD